MNGATRMPISMGVPEVRSAEGVSLFRPVRDADEHRDARLLREQRPHGGHALVDVGLPRGLQHGRVVGGAEPVGRLQRLVEDPLDPRRVGGHHPLRLLQALGVRQGLDRGLDLRVGVGHAQRARASPRPSTIPASPPPSPASELAPSVTSGRSTSSTAMASTPSRSASSSSPARRPRMSRIDQAASMARAAALPPTATSPSSSPTPTASAIPAPPPITNAASGAHQPWRRSSSVPNSA